MRRKCARGWLTDSEKKYRANNLAKEYLRLAKQFYKYDDHPMFSRYFGSACLDMAVKLKELGVSDDKISYRPRKQFEIHRKVIR